MNRAPPLDADGLRALEHLRIRALVERDLATVQALHAADYQLITPAGRVYTRERYLSALAEGPFYADWRAGDIAVRLGPAMGVVRYPAVLVFPSGREVRCWHTDVYECRDGAWQAVWSQATACSPAEAPAPGAEPAR